MKKIQATLIKGKVTSNSSEAHTLFQKSQFGEKLGEKILYSLPEAFLLLEEEKMQITDFQEKKISKETALKKFTRTDKNFSTRYPTFKDLRKKGYVVKTALKFGADFRIYEKGKTSSHSKWLCFTTPENQKISWQDFAAKTRVAHSSKKNLLIAIVDEENSVSYYEIKWTKP